MYFLAPLRNNIVRDLRNKIFEKILALPISFYSNEKKGNLISIATNDVQDIEWSVMQSLEALFREPLNIIGSLTILLLISAKLTLFVLLLLPITGGLIVIIGKSLRRASANSEWD